MKQCIFSLICICFTVFAGYAQPLSQKFAYQAVARDVQGLPLANQTISVQFKILKGFVSGPSVFVENHSGINTDEFGLFTLQIGGGAKISGSITAIDWSADNYFLSVGVDLSNGSSFQAMGTTQMLPVPYAIQSSRSDQAELAVQASKAAAVSFTSPRTEYYHVGCSEFIARNNNSGSWSLHGDQEYGNFIGITGTWRAFATVHLPNGAVVNEVRVYYVDASTNNMKVYFRKTPSHGVSVNNLGSVASTETDAPASPIARQMSFNPNVVIDNANYRYTLIFESSENTNNHRLYNVRIRYTIDKL